MQRSRRSEHRASQVAAAIASTSYSSVPSDAEAWQAAAAAAAARLVHYYVALSRALRRPVRMHGARFRGSIDLLGSERSS